LRAIVVAVAASSTAAATPTTGVAAAIPSWIAAWSSRLRPRNGRGVWYVCLLSCRLGYIYMFLGGDECYFHRHNDSHTHSIFQYS
jgi:hypothetical protein